MKGFVFEVLLQGTQYGADIIESLKILGDSVLFAFVYWIVHFNQIAQTIENLYTDFKIGNGFRQLTHEDIKYFIFSKQ